MARGGSGDLTTTGSLGSLATTAAFLGHVVRQPDTLAALGDRVVQTFPRARWRPNVAYKAMPSLEKKGLVRVVSRRTDAPGLTRYEATGKGTQEHKAFMREPLLMPPVLRDVLQAKLEFMTPDDPDELRGLIQQIQVAEEHCDQEFAEAHAAYMVAQRRRRQYPHEQSGREAKAQEAKLADQADVLEFMCLRMQKLRKRLEPLLKEIEGEREAGV